VVASKVALLARDDSKATFLTLPRRARPGSAADQVRGWLDDALGRLERVVAGAS
jgi:hypothetical protein